MKSVLNFRFQFLVLNITLLSIAVYLFNTKNIVKEKIYFPHIEDSNSKYEFTNVKEEELDLINRRLICESGGTLWDIKKKEYEHCYIDVYSAADGIIIGNIKYYTMIVVFDCNSYEIVKVHKFRVRDNIDKCWIVDSTDGPIINILYDPIRRFSGYIPKYTEKYLVQKDYQLKKLPNHTLPEEENYAKFLEQKYRVDFFK